MLINLGLVLINFKEVLLEAVFLREFCRLEWMFNSDLDICLKILMIIFSLHLSGQG